MFLMSVTYHLHRSILIVNLLGNPLVRQIRYSIICGEILKDAGLKSFNIFLCKSLLDEIKILDKVKIISAYLASLLSQVVEIIVASCRFNNWYYWKSIPVDIPNFIHTYLHINCITTSKSSALTKLLSVT